MTWKEDSRSFAEEVFKEATNKGFSDLVATFLGRSLPISHPDELSRFLDRSPDDLHSPMLLNDMELAVSRVFKALRAGEKILIFGDFDVDGLCGTTILYWGLKKACSGFKPSFYIPDRFKEGHGLSEFLVNKFSQEGFNLIITSDCGMGSPEAIFLAKHLGIDVVVTDHHPFETNLVGALAVINPKLGHYPFRDLAGSGVAFKLIQALIERMHGVESDIYRSFVENCIEYVAIGTIADVVPLVGENRILTHQGLEHMMISRLPFISDYWIKNIIRSDLGEKFRASHVSFKMAPLLNAASRLESPYPAFRFLTSKNSADVRRHGQYLEVLNQERRKRLNLLLNSKDLELIQIKKVPMMVVHTHSSELGLLGLIAARMSDESGQAVLALGHSPDGLLRGSARGPGRPALQEVFRLAGSHLEGFGGHDQAAGLQLKPQNLGLFIENLEKIEMEWDLSQQGEEKIFHCKIKACDLGRDLRAELDLIEPFGEGFEPPIFRVEEFDVLRLKRIGSDGQHISFQIRGHENRLIKVIGFGFGECEDSIVNAKFLIGYLEFNYFRQEEIQLRLLAFE